MLPATTSSGTGLAGMETSFMVPRKSRCAVARAPYSRARGGLNHAANKDLKQRYFNGL
jgi:hypothetical protein